MYIDIYFSYLCTVFCETHSYNKLINPMKNKTLKPYKAPTIQKYHIEVETLLTPRSGPYPPYRPKPWPWWPWPNNPQIKAGSHTGGNDIDIDNWDEDNEESEY